MIKSFEDIAEPLADYESGFWYYSFKDKTERTSEVNQLIKDKLSNNENSFIINENYLFSYLYLVYFDIYEYTRDYNFFTTEEIYYIEECASFFSPEESLAKEENPQIYEELKSKIKTVYKTLVKNIVEGDYDYVILQDNTIIANICPVNF